MLVMENVIFVLRRNKPLQCAQCLYPCFATTHDYGPNFSSVKILDDLGVALSEGAIGADLV